MSTNENNAQMIAGELPNTIPLAKAIEYTTSWRNSGANNVGGVCAFYINKSDIDNLHTILNSGPGYGCRAYLAIDEENMDPAEPTTKYKLLMVPVITDMIAPDVEADIYEQDGYSRVFDFTKPCPSTCDHASPLLTGNE